MSRTGVALVCAVTVARADASVDASIPILVAWEAFSTSDIPNSQWLARFTRALEGEGRLEAKQALSFGGGGMLRDASASDADLRQRALGEGARFVVVGQVTRLAQDYSLDVRVLRADENESLAHYVLEGQGVDGLDQAIQQAADGVRTALEIADQPSPKPEPVVWARPEFGSEADVSVLVSPNQVVEVRVQGNRRIEADAIRAVVAIRVGEPLRSELIGSDVRRIYELGFFADVQVIVTDTTQGKIVVFVVQENPIIRQVSVSGNDNVGSEDIKDQLTLTVGSTIDYPLLIENSSRVEALYKAQGFHLVQVSYSVEPLNQDSVAINFSILEGDKLRLISIQFEGNDNIPDKKLMDVVQTKPWGWTSYVSRFWDRSGVYAEPIFYQDLDRVARAYMDEGFIRARVGEPEVSYEEKGLIVTVQITEGPRYNVGGVDVAGDPTMNREELLGLLELTPDDTFSRSTLTGDVERLRSRYADRGFFLVKVTPRTSVDDEALSVDVTFEVEKGDLYFVDRIEIRGNTRTRDPVVRREIGLTEGVLYSANELQRSRARVRRLGFFEEVDVQTRQLDSPHRVAVDVDVVERPTGSFSFGAGYGSSDGFLVNTSVRQDNLFGKGYGLVANVDLGSRNSNIFLRFTDPFFANSPASFSGTIGRTDREFVDFDQEQTAFSTQITYPLDEGPTRLGTGYSFSQREVTGIDEFQASSLLQREELEGKNSTSLLSFSLTNDSRDDIRFPKQGQISGLALEFAGLGGLTQFLRAEGRTTWFFPVKQWTGFESTFIVNSRIGYTFPFNDLSDFDLPDCDAACQVAVGVNNNGQRNAITAIDDDLKLPLTERYFLGGLGAFQVRGFRQRSLGPRRTILDQFPSAEGTVFFPSNRNSNASISSRCLIGGDDECNDIDDSDIDDFENLDLTDVIGGSKMFLLNLELSFPISEELGLTGMVFFDMGNAFAEDEAISPANLRFGTGAGVQWFSPFGPILVQLGFPLDALEDEDNSVFEFSLGGNQYQ